MRNLGPEERIHAVFATLGACLFVAPFVSGFAARVGGLGNYDVSSDSEALGKPSWNERACGRDTRRRAIVGLRPDGGSELSASALCFRDGKPQCVIIRENLVEVTPRVTFDGRVLQTSSEPIHNSVTGEAFTLLRVWPPDPIDATPPIGRAWVVTGRARRKRFESPRDEAFNATRKNTPSKPRRASEGWLFENLFEPVGEAVPLLLLRDPDVAREVNNAVALIRSHMDGVKANRLVMRLGNCITRATYNPNDMEVMTEVISTLGLKRCQSMLQAISREFDVDEKTGGVQVSEAPNDGANAIDDGAARRRRSPEGSTSAEEDDGDVVEGPEISSLNPRDP
jgi:hypothetical protein